LVDKLIEDEDNLVGDKVDNTQLQSFIDQSRKVNVSDADIKSQLVKSGWNEEEVNSALATGVKTTVPVPPPPPSSQPGMWISFLYIIMFISLYVSATAFGQTLHYFVDKNLALIKDTYSYASNFQDTLLRGYLAAMIVMAPIFIGLFLYLKKQELKAPIIRSFRSRKVLIYLTLIVTFLISIYRIIRTLFEFLNGEVSISIVLHTAITFGIAAAIFIYYLIEVREDRKKNV